MDSLPCHLSKSTAQGYRSGEPIAQFEIGGGKNFIYLILDHQTKRAAIVDPQFDLSQPLSVLTDEGFQLEQIILTHSHPDHTAGVEPLIRANPELVVRVGARDLHRFSGSLKKQMNFIVMDDQDQFKVGNLSVQAFLTPGHSAGAVCYFLRKQEQLNVPYLFTGDTIFIRDCGRTDFKDGSDAEMFSSIQKIKNFPPETIFLVGHHYAEECATTLAREMLESPPFQVTSIEQLRLLE